MARKIEVEIVGNERDAVRAFKRTGDAGTKMGHALKSAGKIAAVGLAGGLVAVGFAARSAWKELIQAQEAGAQTGAVIKATGEAAHVSAKHVRDLSEALLEKTGIDDEVIQQGENTLLTFKGIRNEVGKNNDIFDQATKIGLDLATSMKGAGVEGGNIRTTMLKLGKALNDPIKGITSLSRVGIRFTDSQTKMIKGMVESGHKMEAQKFILKELEGRVGGSAEAFGKTLPGQMTIFREKLKNVGADILSFFIPTLMKGMKVVGNFAGFLGDIAGAKNISVAIDIAAGGVKDVGLRIKNAVGKAIDSTDWKSVGMQLGSAISAGISLGSDALNGMLDSALSWVHSHAQDFAEIGVEIAARMMLTLTDPVFWAHHMTLLAGVIITALSFGVGGALGGLVTKLGPGVARVFGTIGTRAGQAIVNTLLKLPAPLGAIFVRSAEVAGRELLRIVGFAGRVVKFIWDEFGRLPSLLSGVFRFGLIAGFFRLFLSALDKIGGALSTLFGVLGHLPDKLGGKHFRNVQKDIDGAREKIRDFKDEMTGLKSKKVQVAVEIEFAKGFGSREGSAAKPDGDGMLGLRSRVGDGAIKYVQAHPGMFMPPAPPGVGGAGLVPGIRDELGIGQAMGLSLSSGRRAPSKTVTGGQSLHGSGRAIDMVGPFGAMMNFAHTVGGRPGVVEVIAPNRTAYYPGAGWVGISGALADSHSGSHAHVHVGVSGDGLVGMPTGDGKVGDPYYRMGRKQIDALRRTFHDDHDSVSKAHWNPKLQRWVLEEYDSRDRRNPPIPWQRDITGWIMGRTGHGISTAQAIGTSHWWANEGWRRRQGEGLIGMPFGDGRVGGKKKKPPTKKQKAETRRKAAEAKADQRAARRGRIESRGTARTDRAERKQTVKGRVQARRQRRRDRSVEDLTTDAGVSAAKREITAAIKEKQAMIALLRRERTAVLKSAAEAAKKKFPGLAAQYRQKAQDITSDIRDLQEDINDLIADRNKIKKEDPETATLPEDIEEEIFDAEGTEGNADDIAAWQKAAAFWEGQPGLDAKRQARAAREKITELQTPEQNTNDRADLEARLAQANARLSASQRAQQLQTDAINAGVFGSGGGAASGAPTIVLQSLVAPTDEMVRHAASVVTEGMGSQGFVGSSTVTPGI